MATSGYKSRFSSKSASSNWLGAITGVEKWKNDANEWAISKGAKDYNDKEMMGGSTILKPMRRSVVNGVMKEVEFDEEFVPMELNGRMLNVDTKKGISILDSEYLSEKVKKKQEESQYITDLTNIALTGGDDILLTMFPGAYAKAKGNGFLPSNLASLPETSPQFSEALWKLRQAIAGEKDTIAFNNFPSHLVRSHNTNSVPMPASS